MALGNPITWVIVMWKEDMPGQVFVPNNWEVAQNTSRTITEEASVHLCTSHDHNTLQCHVGPEYCSNFCWPQKTSGWRVYSFSEGFCCLEQKYFLLGVRQRQLSHWQAPPEARGGLLQEELTSPRKGSKKKKKVPGSTPGNTKQKESPRSKLRTKEEKCICHSSLSINYW